MKRNIHEVIAGNVREYRRMAHMTQEQLAESIGKEQGYISKIENCTKDSSVNCVNVLSDIADVFGIPVEALFRQDGGCSVSGEMKIISDYGYDSVIDLDCVMEFIYRDFGFVPEKTNCLSDDEMDNYRFSYEEFTSLEISPVLTLPVKDAEPEYMHIPIIIICARAPFPRYGNTDESAETRLYAIWGGSVIAVVSGMSLHLPHLTYRSTYGELDSYSDIYSDLLLCLSDHIEKELNDGNDDRDSRELLLSETDIFTWEYLFRWEETGLWEIPVFLISDVYVHSNFRREGIFTGLVKAMEVEFGDDFLSCMCLNGTVCDEEDESLPIDEAEYDNENIETNRRIAEKFGWHTTDFINDAADYGIVFAVRAGSDVISSLRNAMTSEKPSEDAGPLKPGQA